MNHQNKTRNRLHLIPKEEKDLIRELSDTLTVKELVKRFKHDRITIQKILGIEEPKKTPKEGFFDVDAFFRSDFILQA